jgi:hypothetical protein
MHKIRNFHEEHSTVGEWQGNDMVCVNRPLHCLVLSRDKGRKPISTVELAFTSRVARN